MQKINISLGHEDDPRPAQRTLADPPGGCTKNGECTKKYGVAQQNMGFHKEVKEADLAILTSPA